MKKIFLLFNAALLTVAVFASPSYAFDKTGCEMNCQKCHTITNDEIKDILKKLKAPDAEIVKVDLSPMKSLWEVSINNKGKMGLFYVDFSKQYVVSGSIIEVKTGKNKTAEEATRLRDSRRVDFSKIPLNQGLVVGDASASRKVAVFTDPDWPYCATLHQEMEKLVQERKDIAFYMVLFPLTSLHPDAYGKAKSIVCNKSIKMLGDAFAKKEIPKTECDTKEIDENIKVAETLGISGTPTLVSSDGRIRSGTMQTKQLVEFIEGPPKETPKAEK